MDENEKFEFDSQQNETILTLAKSLQFVGAVTLVLALVFAIGCLRAVLQTQWPAVITQGMWMIFSFAMGGAMVKAGKEFQAIVTTSGSDISHLMQALDNLRQIYSTLSVIIMICIVLAIVALALSLLSTGQSTVA